MKPNYTEGERTPEIEAMLASGESFKLSDLRGKYVMLDFWGSWCGPCRAQSPTLVDLYKRYKDAHFKNAEGFEIVSIGIETKEERWKRAIQKDNKYWPYHIIDKASNLRFINSPIADAFGVNQVPTKYLLGPSGQVIGVNMPFETINDLLSRQLSAN